MIAGVQLFLTLSASGGLQVSTMPAHAHSHEAVLRSRILRFEDLHVNVSHRAPTPTSRGCIIFLVASAQEDVNELLLGLRNLHACESRRCRGHHPLHRWIATETTCAAAARFCI